MRTNRRKEGSLEEEPPASWPMLLTRSRTLLSAASSLLQNGFRRFLLIFTVQNVLVSPVEPDVCPRLFFKKSNLATANILVSALVEISRAFFP